MERIQKINTWRVVQALLAIVAMVFGGAGMAMADLVEPQIGNEGPAANNAKAGSPLNPGSDHDPVDPSVNDRVGPGGNRYGQDLTGTQLSSTQLTKGDLVEDEWDSNIVKYKPFRNPLLSIARQVTRKQTIQNWSVNHMRVGGETLEVVTTAAITAGNSIKLTTSNCTGSLRPFYKGSTVFALGVDGYKRGSKTLKEGELMLFVTDVDKTGVTLQAVNGPARTEGEVGDELDYVTCPAIPAGTVLSCGATAAGESQLMISPENFQPRPQEVYVQKKLLNIVWTEDFEKVKRKQPIKVQDIKEDALYKYNMRAERTYWRGVKGRFNVQNADGSVEYVYTSQGILWQLTNAYAVDGGYKLEDLIALSRIQFTDFSESNHAFVFCGKQAMSDLLNIDPGQNRRVVFTDYNKWNLDFKQFKTTFGTLDFIWDQTLDMLHLEDCMIVLDLEGAVRYVKITEKEQTNDMSKGAGEIREGRRFIHQEADAVALRGYNSVIVGPSAKVFGLPTGGEMNRIKSANALPSNPADGTIVALTADYVSGGTTYEKGKVYQYTVSGQTGAWNEYAGLVIAG